MRAETAEQLERAQKREQDPGKYAARLEALIQEQQMRVAELRQKHALHVQLRLLSVLVVHQPKLLITAEVTARGKSPIPWQLVWDPLTESLEAPECPNCGGPTFELVATRLGQAACSACVATTAPARTR
jgi:hypothetical protein